MLSAMSIDLNSIQLFSATIVDIGTNLPSQFELTTHGLVLAQQFQNTDLMANVQVAWTDFLHTGKAGVLAIGLVLGYTIRSMTG
ncbi:hypothetical protein [Chamaesiphon sp.]|uniref:hypothetical protein n=1 Tax=Chamaesiphon sp. TaxID=2814140 RepID=UPI003593B325